MRSLCRDKRIWYYSSFLKNRSLRLNVTGIQIHNILLRIFFKNGTHFPDIVRKVKDYSISIILKNISFLLLYISENLWYSTRFNQFIFYYIIDNEFISSDNLLWKMWLKFNKIFYWFFYSAWGVFHRLFAWRIF